jgi:hypothetical protein
MKKLALLFLCAVMILTGCQTENPSSEVTSELIYEVASEEAVSFASADTSLDMNYTGTPSEKWQEAYINVLKSWKSEPHDYIFFSLRNFNDDKTPELIIEKRSDDLNLSVKYYYLSMKKGKLMEGMF